MVEGVTGDEKDCHSRGPQSDRANVEIRTQYSIRSDQRIIFMRGDSLLFPWAKRSTLP